MAKQFAGFTPQQTAVLLQKMGYTGPADSKSMQQFIASNPAAAARLGKYTETAQRMIAGQPAAKVKPPAAAMGMQAGGAVPSFDDFMRQQNTQQDRAALDAMAAGNTAAFQEQMRQQAMQRQGITQQDIDRLAKLQASNDPSFEAESRALNEKMQANEKAYFQNQYQNYINNPATTGETGSANAFNNINPAVANVIQGVNPAFGNVSNDLTNGPAFHDLINGPVILPIDPPPQEEPKPVPVDIPVAPPSAPTVDDPTKIVTDIGISRPDIVSAATNVLKSGEKPTSYTLQKNATGGFDMVFDTGAVVQTGFRKQSDADWNANAIIKAANTYSTQTEAAKTYADLFKKYQEDVQAYTTQAQTKAAATVADPQALTNLQNQLNTATIQRNQYLQEIQNLPADDPRRATLSNIIADADKNISALQQQVTTLGNQQLKAGQQALVTKAYTAPEELVTKAATASVSEEAAGKGEIAAGTGSLGAAPSVTPTTVTAADQVTAPTAAQAKSFEAVAATPAIEGAMSTPAVGAVSDEAQAKAATAAPTSLAQLSLNAAQIEKAREVEAIPDMTVSQDQLVTAAKASVIPAADAAISAYQSTLEAAQGAVKPQELVDAAGILNGAKAVEAIAVTMEGLNSAAVALAAQGEFTPEALAVAAQGTVSAMSTVQGQLSALMQSFNNGTPAWAAGAMRSANAAMAARGLGGSSMAAAAIVQAAMESATPIAAADAKVFADMELTNLNNRQQVALANAAAQAQLELSNLNNRQQAMLQNSANSFALQSQNLSNQQQVVLANAQFKAALQEQSLNINTQAALANAARYAEVANINLSNQQQTALQRSAENLQVEMANLSNRQQTAIANAQIEAAIRGQELSNEQQARVVNAARIGEIANINFTAKQQRALENARLAQTVDIENLSAKNAKLLADAAAMTQLDITNLSNQQQAAVQNAQAFLQMDLQNLNNQQQSLMFNSQARVQALLTDAAAQNAAKQFNASSEMQVEQFNNSLNAQISQFNTAQLNALNQFNAGETNAAAKFNAEITNARDVFEAQNALVIAQSNAQWRQNITTLETQQQHQANMQAAAAATAASQAALESVWQRERDLMQYAFTAAENSEARATEILISKMGNESAANIASAKQKADNVATIFSSLAQIM